MSETTKDRAIQLIQRLPEDATIEDIMYELYFRERVDRGIAEVRRGETVPHEEVVRNVAEWLRSTGH
jgi:predicted transcriptional regulator